MKARLIVRDRNRQCDRLADRRSDQRRRPRAIQKPSTVRQIVGSRARQTERIENAPYRVERNPTRLVGVIPPSLGYAGALRELAYGRIAHCGPRNATVE